MKNLVYSSILLISVLISNLSIAQYSIRKVSPAISAPGGSVSLTLRTPTNFNYTTGASMDVTFKSRETNAVQFAIVARGLPSWGLYGFGGEFRYQHPEFINSSFSGGIDSLQKYTFTLPLNAPLGLYDIIINNVYSPQVGMPQPITRTPIFTLTGGLFIEGGGISGKIFYDTDGNGVKNVSDYFLDNQEVLVLGNTSTITGSTDQNGVYKLNLAVGTY
ncbi:MAG: hypothetical protein K2Q22_13920, partial [Cytophagales bacterium]|nr:hypothetical protein [Cytophagales bacterium]